MDDIARVADKAIGWQRFGYVGVGALVLMGASFSNTERRLFDGGPLPAAFSAVPAPLQSTAPVAAALPLLRSFTFRPRTEPDRYATPGATETPGATPISRPVGNDQLAALLPSALSDTPGLSPFVPVSRAAGAAGPGAAILTPAGAAQPSTTLAAGPGAGTTAPIGGGGSGGTGGTGTGGTGTGGTGTDTGNTGTGGTGSGGTGLDNTGAGNTGTGGTGTGTVNTGTGNTGTGGTGTGSTGGTTNPGGGTNPTTGTTPPNNTGTPPQNGSNPVSPVPEPATWATMLLGFLAIGLAQRARAGIKRAAA